MTTTITRRRILVALRALGRAASSLARCPREVLVLDCGGVYGRWLASLDSCGAAHYTLSGRMRLRPVFCIARRFLLAGYASSPGQLLADLHLIREETARWVDARIRGFTPIPVSELYRWRRAKATRVARVILWVQERVAEALMVGDYDAAALAVAEATGASRLALRRAVEAVAGAHASHGGLRGGRRGLGWAVGAARRLAPA